MESTDTLPDKESAMYILSGFAWTLYYLGLCDFTSLEILAASKRLSKFHRHQK